ncbi:DUF1631 family protein [Chitinibacter sp. S2-10]|uniref:DUF1631 family protein n=1 Tax=Chitinibacter sp. S2-10 TaxID=3373597 RepID=UPI003977A48F
MSQPEMSQPLSANNHTARAQLNPMLLACRDLAVKMLTESLDQFFAKLEETYLELGDKTVDRKLRDDYFAARLETHRKRAQLAEQFKAFFNTAFDDNVKVGVTSEQKFYRLNADAHQLSLVANEEYEETLSADKIINSIKSQGAEDLDQLEMRFARLLGNSQTTQQEGSAANPMSPEAICEAFFKACKQLETGVDARLVAMQAFEKELSSQVANVYHQINQYLIAQNVQPLPRPARASSSPQTKPEQSATSSGETARVPGHSTAQQLGKHLAQLVRQDHPGSMPQGSSELQSPGWWPFLDALQRKSPINAALCDENGQSHTHNLLGMLRESGWGKQLNALNAMTLELVTMLFEHIFDDPRLPTSMKSLIGRLQIPVLKVGMMDAAFFSQKQHPARMFLDELAFSALDADDLDVGTPQYQALADIVNHLLRHYEQDVGVFADALNKLRQFVAQLEASSVSNLADDVHQLAERELAELGHSISQQLISLRLNRNADLPLSVSGFLQQIWSVALEKAYGAAGESEPEFIRRLSAMDDLLWSIQPKKDANERYKMVNMLPGMLKTLEEGALAAGVESAQAQIFFAELVQCHAAAIRNGLKAAAGSVHDDTNKESAQSDQFNERDFQAEEIQSIESGILPERGEWVDWHAENGQVIRMRLSWISPQQTRYLFTNRNEKGLAFAKAELVQALYNGRMNRLALQGSLTDRAMQGLMSDLC